MTENDRTREQLEVIKDTGGIYIVHTPGLKLRVQTLIAELWGLECLARICVVVQGDDRDGERIRRSHPPVIIDHALWENVSADRCAELADIVARCNSFA